MPNKLTHSRYIYELYFAGTKSHVCEICGKSFKFITSYTRHKELHGNAQFNCDHCTKVFPSLRLLNEHRSRHQSSKKYVCLCGKEYQSSSGLHHHQGQCAMVILQKQENMDDGPMTVILPNKNTSYSDQLMDISELKQVMDAHKHVTIHVVNKNQDENKVELVAESGDQAVWGQEGNSQSLPDEYLCGYCQTTLGSLEEVQAHMVQQHIGEGGDTQDSNIVYDNTTVEEVEIKEEEAGENIEIVSMDEVIKNQSGAVVEIREPEKVKEDEDRHAVLNIEETENVVYHDTDVVIQFDNGEQAEPNSDVVIQYDNTVSEQPVMTDEYAASLLAAIHTGEAAVTVMGEEVTAVPAGEETLTVTEQSEGDDDVNRTS